MERLVMQSLFWAGPRCGLLWIMWLTTELLLSTEARAVPPQRAVRAAAAKPQPVVQRVENEDAPADAAEVKPAPKPPALPNPVQNFIQRIFQPRNAPILPVRPGGFRVAQPAGAEGEEGKVPRNPSDRDFIDSRAPHDAKIEHQLRLAQTAIKKNDWKQAVSLLQQLLDLPEDSLHRQPDGRWQSVRVTASRELGRAPGPVLESYQLQNGGLARQLLTEAAREGDVSGIIRVAARFFHTDAGYQAADMLMMIHQDRAEFGIAAQWVDELLASRAPFISQAAWRLKAAAIFQQIGRQQDAHRVLEGMAPAEASVLIGGATVVAQDWIAALPADSGSSPATPSDWPQLYGTSTRHSVQDGTVPFLVAEWEVPYSASHAVRQRASWLIQDVIDQERPIVLAAQPLAVQGKAIYRDLRSLRAVDMTTGKTLWESIEGVSPERIISGLGNTDQPTFISFVNGFADPFQGQQGEYHPLISHLLRDAAYNTISSDGRQIFLLEDQGIMSRQQPGWHWGWDGDQSDQYGFSWSTNRLSSYDLETGRPLWTVGGPETNESFQLPLAGVYFHGAPTPEGDDLFVIGAKGDETRLWCLDRRTGGLRWSQLIGYADSKIDQDIVRRWMAAIPSVSEGIVVCPTTIGWLVAVDRLRHSVLWAVRFSPPTAGAENGMVNGMGNNFAQQRELGGQWGVSAPIVAGQNVLYTPPEDNVLVCVDLVTGEKRWQVQRDNGLYLAGVTSDRAVIVEQTQVSAVSLTDGKKKLWTHPIEDGAKPAGRAALTATQLYLPLSSGELREIQLDTGATTLRTFVPSGQSPLGNLVLHQGRMISLSPQGLAGFRQQSALLEEIQRRKAANPLDPIALLNEAEILLLNRQADQALPLLRQISPEGLTGDFPARLHRNVISALTAEIRRDLTASEAPLKELEQISASPIERLEFLDLSAERFLKLNRHDQAFEIFWKLTTESTDGFVTRTDDAKVQVQRVSWLRGRLRDAWTASAAESRQEIDRRIADVLANAAAQDIPEQRRLTDLISFHPTTQALVRTLIEARLAAGETALAELELQRLKDEENRQTAGWATWKLAGLMEDLKLPADAAYYYRQLETDFADIPLPDGRTGAQCVDEIRQTGRLALNATLPQAAWDERPLKVVQAMHLQYGQPSQEISTDSRLPFLESLNIEYLPQEQRVSFESRFGEPYRWLAPLRISPSHHYGGYMAADPIGHALSLVHFDVLHLLSPLQKQLLWSVPLDGLADGGLPPYHANRPPILPLWSIQQGGGYQAPLMQQSNPSGRVAAVQTSYVAVHGRRTVHVLDSRHGTELWRRTNLLPGSRVVGGPEVLWIVPPNMQQTAAYRISDGSPISVEHPEKILGQAVSLAQNDLLLAEQGKGLKLLGLDHTKSILRRYNPLTKTDMWRQEFGANAMMCRLSDEDLIVVTAAGAVELVNVATGKRQSLESLTANDLQNRAETFALADDQRVFLIVNSNANNAHHHFAESLPSVRMHGTIFTWQRDTGKFLWKHTLNNQHLIVDRFRTSPVLLCLSREWKQKGNVNFSQLNLAVLHKQSGKLLHESTTPTMYNGFQSLAIIPEEQALELRSYNLRVRLVPAEPAPEKPAVQGSD